MSKDHRVAAGRYGAERASLSRDDFASIIFTLLPVEEPAVVASGSVRRSTTNVVAVSAEVLATTRESCAALVRAWPDEPIATLSEAVTDYLNRLADLPPDVRADVLYAAALLCTEDAARSGAEDGAAAGSATAEQLKDAARALKADVGASVEAAFAD